MKTQVRIPANLVSKVLNEVYRHAEREPLVFAFASHARTRSRELILIKDVAIPPDSAFMPSNGHGARWKGAYTIELLNRALERQLGLFLFHAHPGSVHVRLSEDDLRSAQELLPRFQLVLPERPHGSIVLGQQSVAGLVLMPNTDKAEEDIDIRFIERERIRTWPLPAADTGDRALLERQPFTSNALLRRILEDKVIAVVGLSGGGSQVVPYLAALGVREIIGIDNQTVDSSNLFASPNMGWLD
jgi:hypothetical protein